jgi:hypothetical protein
MKLLPGGLEATATCRGMDLVRGIDLQGCPLFKDAHLKA